MNFTPYQYNPYINQPNNGYSMPLQSTTMPQNAILGSYPNNSIPTMQNANLGQYTQNGINGKIVADVANITPNDVPMDGSTAIFPSSDMSVIYAKSWNTDGTIKTVVFKPETVQNGKTETEIDSLREYIDAKFDKLEKIIKPTKKKDGAEE